MTRRLAVPFLLLTLACSPSAGGPAGDPGGRDDAADGAGTPDPGPDPAADAGRDGTDDDPAAPDPGPRDVPAGSFGAPCLANGDCDSGFCLEGVEGFVCSQACIEGCPEGWACRGTLVGQDVISLCVQLGASLCKPCRADAQCGDGLCLQVGGEQRCGKDCRLQGCPAGYRCADVDVPGGGAPARQCLPESGACDCGPGDAGAQRPCVRANDLGTCLGVQSCDPASGWSACSAREPAPEACNGIDDDCDGVADDAPEPPAGTCTNEVPGVGACPGTWVCRGEAAWDCAGPAAVAEACDYQDNDCDGVTDDGFVDGQGRYHTEAHCGACGHDCRQRIPFAAEVSCSVEGPSPACVVLACEAGYVKSGDGRCVPRFANLCVPCTGDADCGGDDRCLDLGGARFCGRDCREGSASGPDCPAGFACADLGGGVRQCRPASGSCDCTLANAGMRRSCQAGNAWGTCYGTETCDPDLGWTGCTARTPAPEQCNGVDDDCDGTLDDDPAPPAQACQRAWTDPASGEAHACTAPWQCVDEGTGTAWACHARTPSAEACDYQDNDCDGSVDEDFRVPGTSKYGALDHCGACGVSCRGLVAHGTTKCDTGGAQPRCVVDACDPGYWKASDLSCAEFPETLCQACASDRACQVPGDACLPADRDGGTYCLWDCSPSSPHPRTGPGGGVCPAGYACRASDRRCVPASGACDCLQKDDGDERVCYATNALGTCQGIEWCDPSMGWTGCSAAAPAAERCNGVDDDCDGLPDEGFPGLGQACFAGTGECRAMGSLACDAAGTGTACDAVPGVPETEVCDGLDNDCDGTADEAWPDLGRACLGGTGQCARAGTWACTPDETALRCDATPGAPASEACNLLDDDCDGQTDEDFKVGGAYAKDTTCGSCYTDCTAIYDLPRARGTCSTEGGAPACRMTCDPGAFDLDRVPQDGCEFVLEATAVYVSVDDGAAADDDGCGLGPTGTGAGHHPCRTLARGLARATALGRTKVLVADGLYEEAVTLANGVSLLGGYRPDTWERHLSSTGSTLRAPGTGANPKTVSASGIDRPTIFEGFLVYGPIATAAGGNSYALWVKDCSSALAIRANEVHGGMGGPGAAGSDGANGAAGTAGSAGAAAKEVSADCFQECTAGMETAGGAGGARTCEGSADVGGGAGGRAVCPDWNGSDNACNACSETERQTLDADSKGRPGANGAAAGGTGGYHASIDWRCLNDCGCAIPEGDTMGHAGTDGAAGAGGSRGAGCGAASGSVAAGEWVGGAGADGLAGTHGGGGGGGGAGGGVETTYSGNCKPDGTSDIGGSGGGGGSGGCRGLGGRGGQAGGGAFDLFVTFSATPATVPAVAGNTFHRGFGGNGGSGGNGGVGGVGGAGASGGASGFASLATYCASAGGRGGQGGQGGHGGGGGGGCGGASYGIHAAGHGTVSLAAWKTSNTFGAGGAGGLGGAGGGSLASSGTAGTAGASAATNF